MTATAPPVEAGTNNVPDFGFERLELAGKTARFEMPMVSPEAFLEVRTATAENTKYNAASLRMGGKRQRQIAAGGILTSSDADQDRKEDRILYPKYVFVGWGGIFDKNQEIVKPTQQNVKEFFAKLPTWIFDKLRIFCMRPERFVGADDADLLELPDVAAMAEN